MPTPFRPPIKPPPEDQPLRHVIEEYKHKARTVTCVCGWHGSSASPDGRSSEWSAHLVETRGNKR